MARRRHRDLIRLVIALISEMTLPGPDSLENGRVSVLSSQKPSIGKTRCPRWRSGFLQERRGRLGSLPFN